jgi:cholesterol transport system auxiliary component
VIRRLIIPVLLAIVAGCGSAPRTQYYALAVPPARHSAGPGRGVLSVDELTVAAAYDDQRIVYRRGPYRLDYYEYHQWSAAPSLAISDYVRDALEQSGRFERVTDQRSTETTLVLRGRIAALEEVDVSATEWVGRVDVELYLEEPKRGNVIWSRRFREERPLATRHPSGLAQALSQALAQIVAQAALEISAAGARVESGQSATSALPR